MSTKLYRKCCKCGATASQDEAVPFYRFPKPGKNNILKAKAWAIYCWPEKTWNDIDLLALLHKQSKVLCGRHFEESCFLDGSKKHISKFAVPGTAEYVLKQMKDLRSQAILEPPDTFSAQIEQLSSQQSVLTSKLAIDESAAMSKRTVINEHYKGLVESFAIPAELHERDGKRYASFGSAVPIHCCTPEEVAQLSKTTHHYADIFTEQELAPLGELAYVRLDENTAEKVFINRSKRAVVVSSDGRVSQWRCAPTFESSNRLVAGAPLVTRGGALLSLLTARRGNHYAVSAFEGDGGYFETTEPWKVLDTGEGQLVYGDRTFPTRDLLLQYVASLPPAALGPDLAPTPVLHRGPTPRIALVAPNGRQLAHYYLHGVTTDVEYL